MTDSKLSSPRLDDATQAWLREMAKTHGPGAASISRRMAEWRAFERTALRFYEANRRRPPPPEIRDGIERHYVYIMGSTVAQRNKAIAENYGKEYERVHERAISNFHA